MKKFVSLFTIICLISVCSTTFATEAPQKNIQSLLSDKIQSNQLAENNNENAEPMKLNKLSPPAMAESINPAITGTEYSISGSISLPSGVTTTSPTTVWVYAYTPGVDSNNKVIDNELANSSQPSVTATIPAGSSSANYSLKVNSGKYIILAQVASSDGGVLSTSVYYNSTGAKKSCQAAEILNVTSNVTGKNITLLKASKSIKGRISLPTGTVAPTGGIEYGISCLPNNGENYLYTYVIIPAGKSYVNYSIGTENNSYRLYLSSSNALGGLYGGTTSLINDWSNASSVDTTQTSQSNINVTVKLGKILNVTIKFEKALATNAKYDIQVLPDNGYSGIITGPVAYANAGDTQVTSSFAVDDTLCSSVKILYYDSSTLGSQNPNGNAFCYFYSSSKGITSVESDATPVNINTTSSVTINEPTTYTIEGNVALEGYTPAYNTYIYAIAQFTDGEVYYNHIPVTAGTTNANFSIKIPTNELNNYYNLEAVITTASNELIYDSAGFYPDDIKLIGNVSGYTFPLSDGSITEFSGRFSLPTPAQGEGLIVEFTYSDQYDFAMSYYIPPGKSYVNYKTYGVLDSSNSYVSAYIENAPSNIMSDAEINVEDIYTGLDFSTVQAACVKGKVAVPSGDSIPLPISGTVMVISNNGDQGSCNITIPAGSSTYADYEVSMPINTTDVYVYFMMDSDVISRYINNDTYYSENGSTNNINDKTLFNIGTTDVTGIDITLIRGKGLVVGTVSLPPELDYSNTNHITYSIYLETANTGHRYECAFWHNPNYSLNQKYSFSVPLTETDTQFYISYLVGWDNDVGLSKETYYVNKNGNFVRNKNQADKYEFTDDNFINFTMLPISWNIDSLWRSGETLYITLSEPKTIDFYPTIMVGLYDNNGILKGVKKQAVEAGKLNYTIETNGYKPKVFLWNNLNQIAPTCCYLEE